MQCVTPISIQDPSQDQASQRITVPCGRCGACLETRRNQWTFRITQEAKAHLEVYFGTFTYTEKNLPTTIWGEPTLRKSDLQNFLKRLRKRQSEISDVKIRYYAVGEYGTETERPHYHIILFSLEPILIPLMDMIWKHGHTKVEPISPGRIHYITKFHVNKHDHKENKDREPEFATMSRRPGIGHNYIEKNYNYHKDALRPYVVQNGYKQPIPRYYKDKIFDEYEKKEIAEKAKQRSEELEKQEIQRLKKLGKQDPDHELFKRQIKEAQNQKRKSQEKKGLF